MRALALILAVGLAACGPGLPEGEEPVHPMGDPRGAAEDRIVAEFPEPADPWPDTLVGEWRLAGVDEEPLEAQIGVAISIGEDRISFDNCQLIGWRYTYDRPAMTTRRLSVVGDTVGPGGVPAPLPCAMMLPPQIDAMVAAIDVAAQAEKTPENGVRLSGRGRSVLLFRQ